MKAFNYILPSKSPKKQHFSNALFLYKSVLGRNKPTQESYNYLEQLNIEDLGKLNEHTKKFNTDLIRLWAKLEMDSFINFNLGLTINPYLGSVPVKDLEMYYYLLDPSLILNLLEIKFIKKLTLDGVDFENIYITIYEIMDYNKEVFRPYVEFLQKDSVGNFNRIANGYDTNNNMFVELYIKDFNYALDLTADGHILNPVTNKRTKLKIFDSIDDEDIGKINPFPGENI